ncbi:hypothetical protein OOK31_30050 [Streptomyces sp. NBC_00249]|uniref:hypothetical protein n=1 Tax=Streptomyces sp. NBC_00249 TaxID=2975690 RepID=UPI002254B8F7|nr:hypothetical protein [Streptomyces sp. NBC_00249]MCX5198085.1 hypothetical protein [Streptomyces sp. NBC_00249]
MSSHGTYETHVTVRCPDAEELARLESWAGARELKVTHILLARGRTVSQTMLTLPDRTGHERLVPQLRAAGFDPVRVRVETVPWTTEAPGPGGGYYQHHLKLSLPPAYDQGALEALVVPHRAHLSWNARRVQPGSGGRHERFVTQRCRGTASRATAACDTLIAELVESGYEIVSEEREFVLYDSDVSVDDGWIEGWTEGWTEEGPSAG